MARFHLIAIFLVAAAHLCVADDMDVDVSDVIPAKTHHYSDKKPRNSIQSLIGGTNWAGDWAANVTNTVSIGLALEFPIAPMASFEIEGGVGKYHVGYGGYQHGFNQYAIGSNGKFYLVKGVIAPYLGAGIAGLHYTGMTRGLANPNLEYTEWVGAGQVMAGMDIPVAQTVAVGFRGSLAQPIFSRPTTASRGGYSAPGYEDAAAMDSTIYRLMGSLKFAL